MSFRILSILAFGAALCACGNNPHMQLPVYSLQAAPLTAQPFTPDGLNESDQNALTYNCPSQANVVPDYDWDFNGTGYYTVCPSKNNLSDILVHGNAPIQGPICVFPAQIASNGQVFAKPDVNKNDGSPWVQCLSPGNDGVHMSFTGISWNAAFIVDAADVQQMSLCIQGGIYMYCPKHYSFGSFR
jgi:hypothetical protein